MSSEEAVASKEEINAEAQAPGKPSDSGSTSEDGLGAGGLKRLEREF